MNRAARRNREREFRQPMIRTLFETCHQVFANGGPGCVPHPTHVQRLCSVLDGMNAADVGLCPEMAYFRATESGEAPLITFLQIYLCEKLSMIVFCLPPGGVLPLHNHPGMTVFSKILFGKMHIKSYDWATHLPSSIPAFTSTSHRGGGLAKLIVEKELEAPCNTRVLYPAAGGNIHCFTALTGCAVLDVLGPPYSDRHRRPCTYYLERPFTSPPDLQGDAWNRDEKFPKE